MNLSIDVPDLEAGLRFYGTVFGFKEVARPFPTMAVLDANNVMVCLHEKKPATLPTPDERSRRRYDRHWTPVHIDFHVREVAAVLEAAVAEGATVEQRFTEPKPTAFCSDPFGNGFCVIADSD